MERSGASRSEKLPRPAVPVPPRFVKDMSLFARTQEMAGRLTCEVGSGKVTPPFSRRQTEVSWGRQMEMAGLYLGTEATLGQIGQRYEGISRERVRQVVKEAVIGVYARLEPDGRQEFPVLSLEKPVSLAQRKGISQLHGGLSIEVERLLAEGESPEKIAQQLGRKRVLFAVRILKGWGVDVPSLPPKNWRRYKEELEPLRNPEATDEQITAAVSIVAEMSYHSVNTLFIKGYVVKLKGVSEQAGVALSPRDIEKVLDVFRGAGVEFISVPFSDTRYLYMPSSRQSTAVEVLQNAPELEQYRIPTVRLFGKRTDRKVTTTDLQRGDFRGALRSIGVFARRKLAERNLSVLDIVDWEKPLPVSIWRDRRDRAYVAIEEWPRWLIYRHQRLKEILTSLS